MRSVDDILDDARDAARWASAVTRTQRIALLQRWAELLDAARDDVLALAAEETSLPRELLDGEVDRTVMQLRFFADVVREGSYADLTEDSADAVTGRTLRWMVPVGVVGVFGPSNFPFAYGVLGTDAASAVATGCAVVVKAHPSHGRTSRRLHRIAAEGAVDVGAPPTILSLVEGFEAGVRLVDDDRVAAIGFVGSVGGGRALFDRCAARPRPIPFYGELGSLNPVVVTPGASARDAERVAEAIGTAMLTRHGQMCTKPGMVLVPDARVADLLVDRVALSPAVTLLDDAVRRRFVDTVRVQAAAEGVRVLVGEPDRLDAAISPVVLEVDAPRLLETGEVLLEECFGPSMLVVRYADLDQLDDVLDVLPHALVAGLHADADGEPDLAATLIARLSAIAGRVAWAAPTTGLRVGWASHHGGGYPASTATAHTAVGAAATRRWLRPTSLQGVPDSLVPTVPADPSLPRRVDGQPLAQS